jgi:hypothetical protein
VANYSNIEIESLSSTLQVEDCRNAATWARHAVDLSTGEGGGGGVSAWNRRRAVKSVPIEILPRIPNSIEVRSLM